MSLFARRIALVATVLAGGAFACQIVAGIERVEKPDAPIEAGVDSGTDSAAIVDPCQHAVPPGLPAVDPAPSEEYPVISVFMRELVADPKSDGGTPGFDLDGVCTCDSREGTAEGGVAPCKSGSSKPQCDADGGIDNNASALFGSLTAGISIDSLSNIAHRIEIGRQTVIIFIRHYNGREDDRSIEVGIAPSDGIRPPGGCDGSAPDDPNFPDATSWSPKYCGDDPWTTLSNSVDESGFPKVYGTGWVNGGRFVVKVDRPLRIPFGESGLELGSALITGTLVPLDEDTLKPRPWTTPPKSERGKRLFAVEHGAMAGRAPAGDVLAAAGTFVAPNGFGGDGGSHICSSSFFYLLKSGLCGDLDIPQSAGLDFQKELACDSVSIALGFQAFPSGKGPIYDEPNNDNECTPILGEGGVPHARDYPALKYSCE